MAPALAPPARPWPSPRGAKAMPGLGEPAAATAAGAGAAGIGAAGTGHAATTTAGAAALAAGKGAAKESYTQASLRPTSSLSSELVATSGPPPATGGAVAGVAAAPCTARSQSANRSSNNLSLAVPRRPAMALSRRAFAARGSLKCPSSNKIRLQAANAS